MKFVITGDWQLRYQHPQNRKDKDYFATQMGKVEQILKLAQSLDAPILQPGDFFDGIDTPWFVVKSYIDLFRKYGVEIFCIHGQHDLRYHSRRLDNIPLAVLEAAEVVQIVENKVWGDKTSKFIAQLVGSPWGQGAVLRSVWRDGELCKILMLHHMVVEEKLWEGQTDFTYAKHLFHEFPDVDLFVCGDNHKSFIVGNGAGRWIVNCGSLMRANIDQADHQPIVYVYHTESRSLDEHHLKVKKATDVLDVKRAKEEDARDKDLQAFVEGLSAEQDLGLDFLENLRAVVDGSKSNAGVKAIIDEALERVGGEQR